MPKYTISWKETLSYQLELEAESSCKAYEKFLSMDKKKLDQVDTDETIPVVREVKSSVEEVRNVK